MARLRGMTWILVSAIVLCAHAGDAAESHGGLLIIRPHSFIDVRTGREVVGGKIVVRDGLIVAAGAKAGAGNKGAVVLDLPKLYLLPGFIDSHTHLVWSGPPGESQAEAAARATLNAGFTTVRNLGATQNADISFKRRSDKTPMPRLLAAGMGLGAPGGTCEQVFGAEGNLRTAEDAARTVKQLVAAGADVIKVCAGGGVFFDPNRPAEVELTPALLEAVVSEAHRLGKKVAAHAQGSAAVVNAVNAGVDSIEHGGILSDEAIALMAKRGTAYVPTLARLDWAYKTAQERGAPEQQLSRLLKRRNDAYASARHAFEGGVKIIFGSDASVLPHGRNAMEFRALAEIGLSPQQVIRAATLDAAELLGRDDIGSIRAGGVADLVGFERNPLLDPSVLEQPAWVMRNGVVVFPSK